MRAGPRAPCSCQPGPPRVCRRRSAVSLKSRDRWGKAARNDGKVCEQQKTVWARSVTTEETDRRPQRARGGEDRGGGPEPLPQTEQAATLGLLSRAPLPASSPGLLSRAPAAGLAHSRTAQVLPRLPATAWASVLCRRGPDPGLVLSCASPHVTLTKDALYRGHRLCSLTFCK